MTKQLVPIFTVVKPEIRLDAMQWIDESREHVGEREPSLAKTTFAFGRIPLELHLGTLRDRQLPGHAIIA